MSDTINILERAESMDVSPEFEGYSRVVIWLDTKDDAGNDMYYEAGDRTGRTLEMTCPWGTQQMAADVLERISPSQGRAFQYQPYTATSAILDPAAELGDGVTIKGMYSGIFNQTEQFGHRHLSDISAPTEEEVDHEYPYESATNRKIERKIAMEHAERRAEFWAQEDSINARVVKKYDSTEEAFGWRLDEKQFLVYGGSNVEHPVLKVTKDGLHVEGSGTFTGEIRATSGYIGSSAGTGFTITSSGKLFTNNKKTIDEPVAGVYIGTNGISLGKKGTKSAFKVDSAGNLYATSGTFEGTVYAGNVVYGTKNGIDRGYFDGEGLADNSVSGGGGGGPGKIKSGTVSKGNLTSGVQTNLNHGQTCYEKVKASYVGNYRLNFGSGIVIMGSAFTDSMGGKCSGSAKNSAVVTCTYAGSWP